MTLDPRLRVELGQLRAEELQREAARATATHRPFRLEVSRDDLAVVIRPDRPADELALVALAQLDSARLPASPFLIAEVGGELRAALSLSDGTVIADPFRRTTALVALLTMRAEQLRSQPSRRRRLFARLAPAFALPRR